MHPHHQPSMFPSDYNPMMESPPNANALEVPQHQILNLSQPQVIPNSLGLRHSSIAPPHTPHTSSNFPPDIATILNEGGDQNQYRPSLREGYSGGSEGLTSAQHHARQDQLAAGSAPSGGTAAGQPEVAGEAGAGGSASSSAADERDKKGESMGEDTRFMTRTYNLLTASQDDLGEMMDEYNLYPE